MLQSNSIFMFANFNLSLCRDDPSIHVLEATMESLGRKHASRIVRPTHLRDSTLAFDLNQHDDQLQRYQHTPTLTCYSTEMSYPHMV